MSSDTQSKPVIELLSPPAARRLLLVAVSGGIAAELLLDRTLRAGEQPGLAFSLAAMAAATLVLAAGSLLGGRAPSQSARFCSAVLAFFGLMVCLRASPVLTAINVLICLGAVLMVAHTYSGPSLNRLPLSGYLRAVFGGVASALGGPGVFLANDLRPSMVRFRRLVPLVRGLALAIVPLIVFTVLFAAADAVFADYLGRLVRLDIGSIVSRLVWATVIAWAALGLMRRTITGPKKLPPINGAPPLGVTDAATALVLLNLLFAVFVVVQFAYLFGGADTLAVTGLTYAEYARRGFFELVAVAALVVGLVLALDWLVKRGTRAGAVVDLLHAVLLVLTGVILVSALQRMRLYTAAFGLTELRLYTTVFIVWVAAVLFWMGWTVLRNRRDRFPYGSLVVGLALLAATNLANPDAFIARINVNHHLASGRELDTVYLARELSADAVPALVSRLDELDQCTSAHLMAGLLDRASHVPGWQGRTWGGLRARAALEATELAVMSEAC